MGEWWDFAHWTPGVTTAKLRQAKEQRGLVGVIVGLAWPWDDPSPNPNYRTSKEGWIRHLHMVLEAGLEAEAYKYLYSGTWEAALGSTMDLLKAEIGLDNIRRFWPDAEHGFEMPGDNEARVLEQVCLRINNHYDMNAGVYTAGWWWNPNVGPGDPYRLRRWPVWAANYVDSPGKTLGFGPWAGLPVHTHQYAGTVQVLGLNIDLNWRNQEDTMPVTDIPIEAIARAFADATEHGENAVWKGMKNMTTDLFGFGVWPDDKPMPLPPADSPDFEPLLFYYKDMAAWAATQLGKADDRIRALEEAIERLSDQGGGGTPGAGSLQYGATVKLQKP